jgi:hypothetical protein
MPMMDGIALAMLPKDVADKETAAFLVRISGFRAGRGKSAPS